MRKQTGKFAEGLRTGIAALAYSLVQGVVRFAALVLGLLIALGGATTAQAAGYTTSITTAYPQLAISVSAPQVIWANCNSGGQPSAYSTCDDGVTQIMPIGFTFKYANTNYTNWSMSSNGAIFFETNAVGGTSTATASGTSTYTPNALPTANFGSTNQPALMPFWADLIKNASKNGVLANNDPTQPANASFYQYQVLTVSGAQVLVIQLKNVGYYSAPTNPVNMQIQIWSTGQIVYAYGAITTITSGNNGLTIGLQYPSGGCSNLANKLSTSLSNQSYLFSWDTAAATCPALPTVNHYEIREDGVATLCAEPVTVLACSVATSPCPAASIVSTQIINAAVTVTGTGTLGTPNINPVSFNMQPSAPLQTINLTWVAPSAGTATLGLQSAISATTSTPVCTNAAGTSKFANCNITVSNSACIAPPHHYEVQGPANGSNCASSTFTIKAWADALQTTAYTAALASGTLTQTGNPAALPSLGAFTIPSGSSTVSISPITFPAAGTTTFNTTATPALTGATTCKFGSSTSCAFPVVACAPDHLEIQGSASGVTCLANSFTVKAWADSLQLTPYSSAAVTGNLTATGSPMVTYPSGSGFTISAGSSTTTVNVGVTTPGSVVLGTTVTSSAPAAAATCNFGSPTCTYTANDTGFIFSATNTGGVATLPTQTAGTTSAQYFLRAVQTSTTTGACVAALTSPAAVTLGYACNNPATCSAGSYLDITPYNGVTAQTMTTVAATGTSTNLYFDANGSAPLTFNYRDVGQITLNASKAAGGSLLSALGGSSNAFVVKPGGFSITGVKQTASPFLVNPGAVDANGNKFVKAGEAFTATVSALTSAGAVTPNFGNETTAEKVKLTPTVVAPAGGSDGTLSNSLVTGFSSGVATTTNLAWSEVGLLQLTPNVGDSDYLGAGNVTGTAISNIGRFYADHLDVTALTQGCVPGNFTYDRQPFTSLTITARSTAGTTLTNYRGAATAGASFAKTVTLTDNTGKGSITVGGAATVPVMAFAAGLATLDNTDTNHPQALFSFTSIPSAPVNIGIIATDSDTGAGATTPATPTMRSGRLHISNNFGKATGTLALPVQAQYWSGSSWVINNNDSCTTLPANAFFLTGGPAATTTASAVNIANGNGTLTLNNTGAIGSVDVAANLGTSGVDQSCLAAHGGTAASRVWLRSRNGSCAATYDRDPTARATFGIYAPETRRTVHVQEEF